MDQLKPALEFLKKHGFWLAVGLILLCSIGIWFKVTGDLVAESDSRAQTIRTEIQQVSDVRSVLSEHPNETSHERMEAMIAIRQEEVLDAWTAVFDKQKDILVWPEKELTKDLIDQYRDKIPIESYIHFPILEEEKLPTALLQQYAAYIDKVLPNLAQIAKAEWTAKFGVAAGAGGMGGMGMGGMGMGGMEMDGMEMGMDGGGGGMGAGRPGFARSDIDLLSGMKKGPLVRWSQGAQAGLIKELFPWEGRRPTTLEVYYSQENLWILRQLLTIIADVNGAAKQPFEAKIREIKQLSMGSRVRFTAGNLSVPSGAAMGRGMGGAEMEMDMGMGPADMGMSVEMEMDMGMGGGGMDGGMRGSMEEVDPADNRYVDDKREPITGERLRAAFESVSAEDAKLKVAKRVPVMISVQIDQRAVPELLAACGSAPLMVEVIQTRVFGDAKAAAAAAAASSSGGGAMGMAMGGGAEMGMDGGMGMEMDGGMGMGMDGGASGRPQASDQFPLDVTVEVYGLIHIYNPPQEDKLGVDQVTADTVIDGETMGEQVEKEKTGGNLAAPDAALPAPLPVAEPAAEPAAGAAPAATPPAAAPPAATPPAATPPAAAPPATAPENPGNLPANPVQPDVPAP